MANIADIEGIGAAFAKKLEAAGIKTIEALLKQGATTQGRKTIAEKSGIAEKQILGWVNRADLCRIKGVSTQYGDLLEFSGVDTVVELAQRNSENLFKKMEEVNGQKKLVRSLPTASQVEDWIKQAQSLPRVVTH